jgi:hypothetical protein
MMRRTRALEFVIGPNVAGGAQLAESAFLQSACVPILWEWRPQSVRTSLSGFFTIITNSAKSPRYVGASGSRMRRQSGVRRQKATPCIVYRLRPTNDCLQPIIALDESIRIAGVWSAVYRVDIIRSIQWFTTGFVCKHCSTRIIIYISSDELQGWQTTGQTSTLPNWGNFPVSFSV